MLERKRFKVQIKAIKKKVLDHDNDSYNSWFLSPSPTNITDYESLFRYVPLGDAIGIWNDPHYFSTLPDPSGTPYPLSTNALRSVLPQQDSRWGNQSAASHYTSPTEDDER